MTINEEKRWDCSCGDPEHMMRLWAYTDDEDNLKLSLSIGTYPRSLKERFIWLYNILLGREYTYSDILLDKQSTESLRVFCEKALQYKTVPELNVMYKRLRPKQWNQGEKVNTSYYNNVHATTLAGLEILAETVRDMLKNPSEKDRERLIGMLYYLDGIDIYE